MPLVARRESFGGIVGDSDGYGFHVVNREGFSILRKLADHGARSRILNCSPDRKLSLDAFLCEVNRRGWCDTYGRFRGRFLDNGNNVSYLSAPIRVWLEVTSRCNLSCVQCFNQNHQLYLTPDLSFADIQHIIDELHKAAVIQITVTGGEPLTRKDLFSILDRIVEHQFGLRFFTNGASLTETNATRLGEYPISHLFVSLDGIGAVNDVLRGTGTYQRIKRGLTILSSTIQNITLSTTLHRLSLDGIESVFALAAQHGVRSILIRPLFQYRDHTTPMFIAPENLDSFLQALEAASAKHQVEYQLNKIPFRPLQKSVYVHDRQTDVHFSFFSQHNSFGCVGGNSVVGIKANGVIMACGFLPHDYPVRGNSVLERPFIDLWNNSGNVTVLRDLVGNDVCRNCSLLKLCGGGCRANALVHLGDINAVDPYCFWSQKGPADLKVQPELKGYADGPEPYISERTIVTKCGSGSNL